MIDGTFTPGGFAAALFYLGNYFVIAQDFHGLPAGLGVIWSLAIEEHFYLFYPPLALLLLRARSTGGAALVLAGLCVAVLAWRVWLVRQGMSVEYLTMATDTRVDAILVGCLLALWRNPWLAPQPMHNGPGRVMRERLLVALCLATLLGSFLWRDEAFRQTARYTLQSLAIAGLLHAAVALAQCAAAGLPRLDLVHGVPVAPRHPARPGQACAAVGLGRPDRGRCAAHAGRGRADAPLGRGALRRAAPPPAPRAAGTPGAAGAASGGHAMSAPGRSQALIPERAARRVVQ